MNVIACDIPATSGLAAFRDEAPHTNAQAVAVDLPPGRRVDARELARVAMSRPSRTSDRSLPLVDAWIKVQGVILRPLGVKPNTMHRKREQPLPEVGGRLGPYEVYAADPAEVLLGDRDRFLHHRMSFLVLDGRVCLGVVLRTLNRGGDLYWALVRKHQTRILEFTLARGLEKLAAPHEV